MVTLPLNFGNADNRFHAYITAQKNKTGAIQGNFFPKLFLAQTAQRLLCSAGWMNGMIPAEKVV
jgi:hypothetical protein